MEKEFSTEERPEPAVEVNSPLDLEEEEESARPPLWMEKPKQKSSFPKWMVASALFVVLVGLGWIFWSTRESQPVAKSFPVEAQEMKALKEGLDKVQVQWTSLQKDVENLRMEQKTTRDEIKRLEGQLASLKRKPEPAQAKKPEPAQVKKTEAAQAKKPGKKILTYRVRKGDSLASIARRFRVDAESIKKWNDLGPKNPLQVGQVLILRSAS